MIYFFPPSSLRFRFWQTAPASCTTWEPAKMLGINDFNLQNSKSVTENFFFKWEESFAGAMKTILCTGQGWTEATQLLRFLLFADIFVVFVSPVAVLLMWRYFCCCLFALPITTPGSVARERNWPEVETRLRVEHKFPFSPILPIFYLITLKWHCRPTKKK